MGRYRLRSSWTVWSVGNRIAADGFFSERNQVFVFFGEELIMSCILLWISFCVGADV